MSELKKLGDLIDLIDERNKNGIIKTLIGVSIDKCFIKSVANTIGTDLSKYQIIRKFDFACSLMQVSRDGKIPIACLKDYDEAIMSPAYYIFRIKNTDEILPDYLAMWFMRSEFDREASYIAVGGVRGSMPWEDFCDMKLPVPPLEEQQKIVDAYNAIENRIKIKQKINEKLEATAQAIYRKMFIEDADENWKTEKLEELIEIKYGKDHKDLPNGIVPVYGSGGIMRYVDKALYDKESVLIPRKGSLNNIIYIDTPFWSVDTMFYTIMKKKNIAKYFYEFIKTKDFLNLDTGSAVPSMTTEYLNNMDILYPCEQKLEEFDNEVQKLYERIKNNEKEIEKLAQLKQLIVSQIAKQRKDNF